MAECLQQHRVYLGLGSNIGDRRRNLQLAIDRIAGDVRITDVSSVWDTSPELFEAQPRFLNAVIGGWTDLDPVDLLWKAKSIESALGRISGPRYGPRPLDIDILLYDDIVMESESLTIPHPLLHQRSFVLVPLAEIASHTRHPALGLTMAELVDQLPATDIRWAGALCATSI